MARARVAAAVALLTVAAIGTTHAYRSRTNHSSAAAPQKTKPPSPPSVPRVRPARPPAGLSAAEHALVSRWMKGMSVRDLAAQLVMISSYGESLPQRSREYRKFVRLVRDLHVGGVIVVNRVVGGTVRYADPFEMAAFLNRMQRLARVPLLVGGDFERGASMRVEGTVRFPHLMAYGVANDPALTRELGLLTAREARALGVHWVFAPVADVNSNPENPIINIRAFGDDPQLVARHVQAFIEGAHSDPQHRVLVTAKHFPGHGDTTVDSHVGMPVVAADRARLDTVELVPFRAAVQAGVDSIMTAHLAVPALEPEQVPATVSARVLTDLLRRELNFDGLIVTDAMDMGGLAKQYTPGEAAVSALEAGVDMLLMPPDPEAAIEAVVAAVRKGRIERARLESSVRRVLAAKARLRLQRSRHIDVDELADDLDQPEGEQHALTVAERALKVVRDGGAPLPLASDACVFVLPERRGGEQGRAFAAELKRPVETLWPGLDAGEVQAALERTSSCGHAVAAVYVSAGAYRGEVALDSSYTPLLEALMKRGPVTMVAFGSPYVLRAWPGVTAAIATHSTVPASEIAAARFLVAAR